MIPEYRLINSLVNLPINKVTKRVIKTKIKTLNYDHQTKVSNFIFSVNNNRVFNHIIGLDSELNQYSLDAYFANIVDFNFMVAALMPVFEFQTSYYKDYKKIQETLFNEALLSFDLQNWYQESLALTATDTEPLKFLLSNKKLPKPIKTKIINLTHISGQLFESISANHYQLGYYLMLFYLLNLETKKTLQLRSATTWNLKKYIPYEDLFAYKLLVMEQFSKAIMQLKGKTFNLYWRVMNYIITGHYD